MRERKLEAAVADFQAAIRLKPNHHQAYLDLAQAYQVKGRWDASLESIERALKLNPPGQVVLFRLHARIQQQKHRDQAALDDLQCALRSLDPQDVEVADVQFDRARILHRQRKLEEALAAYDKGLTQKNDDLSAHRLRGAVLMELNRYAEAEREFAYCLSHGKPMASMLEARGLAQAWQGRYTDAVENYTLAIKQAKTSSLYSDRGWAYLFSGAAKMAEHDFSEALRIDGTNVEARGGHGLALAQIGKTAEALDDAAASISMNANNPRAHYNAARIYCRVASTYLATPGRLSDREFELLRKCRAEAIVEIRQSLQKTASNERARFWREVVATDAVLAPIRDRVEFLALQPRCPIVSASVIARQAGAAQP
jgi:superkiller protein 3